MSPKEAIVFKASDDTGDFSDDPYAAELKLLDISCHIISVLSFDFINLDELDKRLARSDCYAGIIFSSPRVVDAVRRCSKVSEWKDKLAFAVGKKTAEDVQRLGLKPLGEESGTGANLADYILKYPIEKPLLMPCGNLATDTILNKLKGSGIEIERIVVYNTVTSVKLEENIRKVVENCQNLNFVLYFSPSGVKATMPLLKKVGVDFSTIKFGAIGPTTEAALQEFVKVSFLADRPTPQHFASALTPHLS